MFDEGNGFELNSEQHVISVLITRTGFIHFPCHNTSNTSLDQLVNLFFLACALSSNPFLTQNRAVLVVNDCDRDQARLEGRQKEKRNFFFCDFTCHGEKIYFCCFDNKKAKGRKKRQPVSHAVIKNVYVPCLVPFDGNLLSYSSM